MSDAPIVEAIQTFRVGRHVIKQGTKYRADDPMVLGPPDRSHLFKRVDDDVRTTASVPGVVGDIPPGPQGDAGGESGEAPTRPAGNASTFAWAKYVTALGGDVDESASRDELVAQADDLEQDGAED